MGDPCRICLILFKGKLHVPNLHFLQKNLSLNSNTKIFIINSFKGVVPTSGRDRENGPLKSDSCHSET